jgi:hypothetical protein
MLEVIRNRDYRQLRFVRSATIDESELQDARGADATAAADHRGRCRQLLRGGLRRRELIESVRIPSGREVTWSDFNAGFIRMRQALKALGAHHACEGIRPGLAAQAAGVLAREPGAGWAP